jgi:mRNA interferase HigB
VNVIALRTLRAFWVVYPEAERPLRDWNKLARATDPRHFADLKTTFGGVDTARAKDDTVVFIFGNKYRLLARIDFEYNVLFILLVLTHKEYDLWNKEGRLL